MLSTSGEDINVVSTRSCFFFTPKSENKCKLTKRLYNQINAIQKGVESKNPGKNFFKHFAEQIHGFAAARGDVSRLLRD